MPNTTKYKDPAKPVNSALMNVNPIDIRALAENAMASRNKETYKLLEKNSAYRIGVGARAPSTDAPSFFIEVLINLSAKATEVDLAQLEKALKGLKALQSRGYALFFEDSNCVSCEKKIVQNPNDEYLTVKSLLKPLLH
jgi:hypothetical protein